MKKMNKQKAAAALATLAALQVTNHGVISVANAASANATTAGAHTFVADTSGGSYVQEDFVFNTSQSVTVSATEDASRLGVASVHSDGQFAYGGTTDGGSVDKCGTTKFSPGSASLPSFGVTGC